MKVRKLFLMLFIAVPLIVMILVGLLAGIFQLKRDIAVSAIYPPPPGKSP
ncbi:Putative rtn protein, partial [Salmonella enterica subsp. enterica serovar Alachua str. R6-377]